ncbi:Histone acetyltransferase, GCN5 family [Giardia duodenalis]|uniref:Histone acetyltransferase GCN5 n=2 Tax=Giardia intestinalis TaxID=5741 RepID=C6LNL4_GIAIB|nr:Histone acetyltransferase GCN5 [Giardia intestinalis ATCC 50581]ESU42331.1 Histone acetyltransferase, GCN5 family [Giardia intestinalis]
MAVSTSSPQEKRDLYFKVVSLNLYDPTIDPHDPKLLLHLLMAKELFCTALPRMPRDYITRLVFNTSHETACLLQYPHEPGTSPLVAAICYRTFPDVRIAEIAFCAVSITRQYSGLGHCIMNYLKEHIKKRGYTDIVTYADNAALEYFHKQGFSKNITMPEAIWHGRVKHYDQAIFVQCPLYRNIDYTKVMQRLRRQRELTLKRIGVTPSTFPEALKGKGYISVEELIENVTSLRQVIEIMGKDPQQTCQSIEESISTSEEIQRCNSAALYAVIVEAGKAYALPFLQPPPATEWTPNIVHNDLQIMVEKCQSFFYRTRGIFAEHAKSLWQRCLTFNGETSDRTKLAYELYQGLLGSFDQGYKQYVEEVAHDDLGYCYPELQVQNNNSADNAVTDKVCPDVEQAFADLGL